MKSYQGQKVLVTGANGFIAGRLVERLILEEGADVRVLMRNWTNASWVSRLNPEFMVGDVTDPESVDQAVAGCSKIFHCASGGGSYDNFFRINVGGTENIIKAAKKFDVERVIFTSSATVHGARFPARLDENTPVQKTGRGYGDSKVAAEELIQKYVRNDGLPAVVIRPAYVWGPRAGQFTINPLSSIKQGSLRLIDKGNFDCPAIYLDNLVDLLLLAGLRNEAIGEVFLATDGSTYTWADFFGSYARMLRVDNLKSLSSKSKLTKGASLAVQKLGELLENYKGNPAPLWKKVIRRSARIVRTALVDHGVPDPWYLALYSNRTEVSIDKAIKLLGYVPRYSLEQGMAATEEWILDQLGVRFELTDELGVPKSPPVFLAIRE